jgi:adenylosuccinate synthase
LNLVVIGAQWGDEGKGKIVDYLSEHARVVVRFSGGANAGHTIVKGEQTYKLHLVPSGVLYPDTTVILGTGMVIDPLSLFEELDDLRGSGIDWDGRLLVSDRAHIVVPGYRKQDVERDQSREQPLGTTGRGIGVAYAMKAARDGIRVCDIQEPSVVEALDPESRDFLDQVAPRLAPMSVDLVEFMRHIQPSDHILFEGAQGALLDLDQGTYPFVSSGHSVAAGASIGGGIGPRRLDRVIGVFKAYSTRVGNGPFPSEFRPDQDHELEHLVRERGREFGVTTGRPRRCGFLDLVALRYVCRANGIDELALTHLDVYDGQEQIRACIAYETEEGSVDTFPASAAALERCQPVTQTFPGWDSSVAGATTFNDLPREAREYVSFIERFVETPISVISVGYERSQTILRKSPWR